MAGYLELHDVRYTYPLPGGPQRPAVDGVSFDLAPGEIMCITGPNGSGKSTLAQLIAGILKPDSGEILLDGRRVWERGRDSARRRIGVLFQSPEDQLFAETVRRDISFGPRNQGLSGDTVESRVRLSAGFLGLDLDSIGDRSPFGLSEGEKRLVALAGVLSTEPELLILDEPTVGQDRENRERMIDSLREYRSTHGASLVLVSHDLDDAIGLATEFAVMDRGKTRLIGGFEDLTASQDVIEEIGVRIPPVASLAKRLMGAGVRLEYPIDISSLCRSICEEVKPQG